MVEREREQRLRVHTASDENTNSLFSPPLAVCWYIKKKTSTEREREREWFLGLSSALLITQSSSYKLQPPLPTSFSERERERGDREGSD